MNRWTSPYWTMCSMPNIKPPASRNRALRHDNISSQPRRWTGQRSISTNPRPCTTNGPSRCAGAVSFRSALADTWRRPWVGDVLDLDVVLQPFTICLPVWATVRLFWTGRIIGLVDWPVGSLQVLTARYHRAYRHTIIQSVVRTDLIAVRRQYIG